MSYTDRQALICRLQELRSSKVLAYVTSDRPTDAPVTGMAGKLGTDALLPVIDQLRSFGRGEKLDLFLYTRGGDIDSVMPLVNAIRSYFENFSVLIPFRAHSAGTLIGLGADEIVMGPFAELSPIDPTTGNQFSPVDEINPKARKGISVEDVISFMELAKDERKVGIQDKGHLLEVFRILSQNVHPLALGNVNRVHNHIRLLATKLLGLGASRKLDAKRVETIVDALSSELSSHTYAIGRDEARDILGDSIVRFATGEEETVLWELFDTYADTMNLRDRFNPKEYLGTELSREITATGAILDSESMSFVVECTSTITQRSELPPNVQLQGQPGQPIPLLPGFPTAINIEPSGGGWRRAEGGT